MNAKTIMWCDCGECAKCRPDLHKKENECVRCGCYNLSEFKKVERKHIHCLDCYKQQRNEKQRENRKQKREELTCECCGKYDKSVGLATGDNCVEMRVCRFCDVDGSDYNGWGDEDIQKCYNCDEVLDEDMHIFCYRKGDDEMVHCQQCAEDCYEEAKADGWVRDDDNGWGDEENKECCDCTKMFSISDCAKIQLEPELWRCFDCCKKKELSDRGMEDEEEDNSEYMQEDMGECPKCDCAVKRKDLAWRSGYYLDICAKCDDN